MKLTDFLHAGTNSYKLKDEWKFWKVAMVTLKLAVSEEWTDRIIWLFAYWYRFTKIKNWSKFFWVGMVRKGYSQSGHGTLKLTVSQKWSEGINWFFACWYTFRKAKSRFNDFWVDMVKNGNSLLVLFHETLKSAAY